MSLFINTNIASLYAQNNVANSQNALATSIQRLSSGLRINSAKDDAAGMAIAARMTSQIGGMTQAAQNANDGISMAQTAEGALAQVTNDLQTMRNLAVQAANGTNSSSDRASLQANISQLQQDISQIASNTQYNGLNLLDGSLSNVQFQTGANAGQTINATIGNASSNMIGDNKASTSTGATATSMDAAVAAAAGTIGQNQFQAQTLSFTSNGTTTKVPATGSLVDHSSAYDIAQKVNAQASSTGMPIQAVATSYAKLSGFTVGAVSLTLQGAPDASGTSNPVTISATLASTTDPSALAAAINSASAKTGITAIADTSSGSIALTQISGYDIGISNNSGSAGTVSFSGADSTGAAVGSTQVLANGTGGTAATSATAQVVAFTGATITAPTAAVASSVTATAAPTSDTITTGTNDTLTGTYNGNTFSATIAASAYANSGALAQAVATAINTTLGAGTVTATPASGNTGAIAISAASGLGLTFTGGNAYANLNLSGGTVVAGSAATLGNNALTVTVDGSVKNIPLAAGTTTSAAAFVTANQGAFNTAGLTLSAAGGGLLVTDNSTGVASTLSAFTGTGATITGLGGATITSGVAAAAGLNSSVVGGTVDFHSASSFSVTSNDATNSLIATTSAGTSTLDAVNSIDVSSVTNGLPTGANKAIFIVDGAINTINGLRAQLGALQNRFINAQSSLTTTSTNMQQARSRIQDTDFAAETANLTHNQILQQAGTAMLAQANALPNSVLTLLK